MNLIQITGALELGLIYSTVAMGLYVSFRVLNFPDLTVDGSFPLGACVCAVLITNGFNPWLSIFCATLLGCVAGLVTAWLSTKLKVLNLLAGILTMTGLYSINLRIMGKPNISLLGESNLFDNYFICGKSIFLGMWRVIPLLSLVIILILFLNWFFKTNLGLAIRATGSNERMSKAQGVNNHITTCVGIAISNALVALGGALFTQLHGFADITMGVGTIIIGLASIIIGEVIFSGGSLFKAMFCCIIGAILYRILITLALNVSDIGLQASDLNLVTAILVGIAMSLPSIKNKIKSKIKKI
jgi:putative ABC transport system permease protein